MLTGQGRRIHTAITNRHSLFGLFLFHSSFSSHIFAETMAMAFHGILKWRKIGLNDESSAYFDAKYLKEISICLRLGLRNFGLYVVVNDIILNDIEAVLKHEKKETTAWLLLRCIIIVIFPLHQNAISRSLYDRHALTHLMLEYRMCTSGVHLVFSFSWIWLK